MTLTFDHVTGKSLGNIYSLGASTVLSSETFKQKAIEWTLLDRQKRPTGAKQYALFFKAGYKNHNSFIIITVV